MDLRRIKLIGMLHLLPLPGSPAFAGSRSAIRDRALRDAEILERAGFDALLIENYGDIPFFKQPAGPATAAEMTAVACDVRQRSSLPIGIQVLRNDASAALGVAAAADAAFIRVNVHTGAMLTDQGIIEGRAAETLRLRRELQCDVRILADVHVKHAVPMADTLISDAARDAVHRGMADGIIVSGRATGLATSMEDVRSIRAAVGTPLFCGSGVTAETVASFLSHVDGVIVGTSIKEQGATSAPVDEQRAVALVRAARG